MEGIKEEMRKVGKKLNYNQKKILGRGNFGSVVYFGHFLLPEKYEHPVAVKRFQWSSVKKDAITHFNEQFMGLESKYLLRYFATENTDEDFFFIVTELCTGTLEKLVKGQYMGPPIGDIDERTILFQVSKGLDYLHSKKVVHGDIKPSNILIYFPSANDGNGDPSSSLLFKLADYGIYSIIELDDTSLFKKEKKTNSILFGTMGWRAPELYDSNTIHLPADIFALGCIFGFTLSGGRHPFGDCTLEQSIQIMEMKGMKLNKRDLKLQFSDDADKAFDLIKSMLYMEPEERPQINEVLASSFFSNQEQVKLPISETRKVQLMKESISYNPKKIIHQDFPRGHIVFSGFISKNQVAINRITTNEIDIETMNRAASSLRHISNINQFVIRFLDMGSSPKFYKFIVTELWEATLEDYVEGHYKGPKFKDDREILISITNGLHYFHCEMKVAHGNIRPKTILICPSSESVAGKMAVKLADTITSACNQEREAKRSMNNRRTFRWRGHAESLLPSEDILPLGCVFAYTFGIGGKNCFDDDITTKIQTAIRKKLTNSEKSKDSGTIFTLIQTMVNRDPEKRPTAAELLNHDFFMDCKNSLGVFSSNELDIKEAGYIDCVSQSLKGLKLLEDSPQDPTIASKSNAEDKKDARERRESTNLSKITYERKNRLGCSAYGAVFLGTFNNKKVAVKRIGKYDGCTGEEEKAFKTLNHPNIIKLLETEDIGNIRFYAFEFCNASLDTIFLDKYQGPPLPGQSTVLLQLSEGLAYIHSKNLVHRGIKPENVLISGMSNHRVVLKWSDFGLNTYVNENENYEMSYTRRTLFWMTPELLEHFYGRKGFENSAKNYSCLKRCTQADDLFAAGCIFFQFLTGVHPFGDQTFTDVIPNIRSNNPKNFLNSEKVLPPTHFAYDSIASMLRQTNHTMLTINDVVENIRKKLQEEFFDLCCLSEPTELEMNQLVQLVKNNTNLNLAKCVSHKGLTPLELLCKNNRSLKLKQCIRILIESCSKVDKNNRGGSVEPAINFNREYLNGNRALNYVCKYYTNTDFLEIIHILINHCLIGSNRTEKTDSKQPGIKRQLSDSRLELMGGEWHPYYVSEPAISREFALLNQCEYGVGPLLSLTLTEIPPYYKKGDLTPLIPSREQGRRVQLLEEAEFTKLFQLSLQTDSKRQLPEVPQPSNQIQINKIFRNLFKNNQWADSDSKSRNILCYIIELLITRGNIDINVIDDNSTLRNALHCLLEFYKGKDIVDIAKQMIENKIDINAKNNEGRTVLHYLLINFSKYENPKNILELFIRYDIDVEAVDNEGRNAFFYIKKICIGNDERKELRKILLSKRKDPQEVPTFGIRFY